MVKQTKGVCERNTLNPTIRNVQSTQSRIQTQRAYQEIGKHNMFTNRQSPRVLLGEIESPFQLRTPDKTANYNYNFFFTFIILFLIVLSLHQICRISRWCVLITISNQLIFNSYLAHEICLRGCIPIRNFQFRYFQLYFGANPG